MSQLRFVEHHSEMVEPDFDLKTINPNDEPFWLVFTPYESDSNHPFLLDRAGMKALMNQLQNGLAQYYKKFPRQAREMPLDLMRPGGPKEQGPKENP